jgi:predicted HAD superfamily Cof-like phosphohydrolase
MIFNIRPRKEKMSDFYADCQAFTALYLSKTGKTASGVIDTPFITKMVQDELQELAEAKDEAEQVDALLDATYYILQHLATTGLDIRPIWSAIHNANMSKFERGHMREDGKWMKPSDFVPPDEEIRRIINDQRARK